MSLRDKIAALGEREATIRYAGESYTVKVKPLSLGELSKIRLSLSDIPEAERDEEIGAEVVVRSIYDPETGERAFENREQVKALPWFVGNELSAAARLSNNFGAVEQAAKNSNGARKSKRRSPSGSVSTSRSSKSSRGRART